MKDQMTRRDCLRIMGMSGFGIGAGLGIDKQLLAQDIGESGFQSSVIATNKVQDNRSNAVLIDGKVIQPRRELPVLTETDVLVVGGGPAGIVAAIAARRTNDTATSEASGPADWYFSYSATSPKGQSRSARE